MEANKVKALEAALSQIDRQFGKGTVMRMGDQPRVVMPSISTGSLGLDIALGIGGLPKGRICEIYGPESSGNTVNWRFLRYALLLMIIPKLIGVAGVITLPANIVQPGTVYFLRQCPFDSTRTGDEPV